MGLNFGRRGVGSMLRLKLETGTFLLLENGINQLKLE